MIAANVAPGMNRDFTAEEWTNLIDRKLWYECVKEAEDMIDTTVKVDIQGYDIDGDVIKAARAESGCRFKPSEKIWLHHHKSTVWRAS